MCAQSAAKCPMGDECSCPKTSCANHGKCCQCIKAHLASCKRTHCMAMLEQK